MLGPAADPPISGPLKGSEFPLNSGEFVIGREPSNAIWLEHSSVSRRHCLIRVAEGRCAILDLDSRNGTFVNRVPVKERDLANGDEVRIGEYVFLLLTRETAAAHGPAESIDDSKLLTRSMILKPEDSRYLRPLGLAGELGVEPASKTARVARDLNSLLAASEAIHSLRGAEAIARRLLESAFEVAPARRGALVLFDESPAIPKLSTADRPLSVSERGWG